MARDIYYIYYAVTLIYLNWLFVIASGQQEHDKTSKGQNDVLFRCGTNTWCDRLSQFCDGPTHSCGSCSRECNITSRNESCHLQCQLYLEYSKRMENDKQEYIKQLENVKQNMKQNESKMKDRANIMNLIIALLTALLVVSCAGNVGLVYINWTAIREKYRRWLARWRGQAPEDPEKQLPQQETFRGQNQSTQTDDQHATGVLVVIDGDEPGDSEETVPLTL